MPRISKDTFPRRQFLKSAAATAGAAIVGPAALAQSLANISKPFALHYWHENGFCDAARIVIGEEKFERVRVTVTGHNRGSLRALEALHFVPVERGAKPIGFKAWLLGSTTSRFEMPVRGRSGISFLLSSSHLGRTVKSKVELSQLEGGFGLREGHYVIVASGQPVAGMRFGEGDDARVLVDREDRPAAFQHLILTIERA